MSKIAYQTNHLGHYVGQVECQANPMSPGDYLMPGGSTDQAPPKNFDAAKLVQKFDFEVGEWSLVERPRPEQES